MYLLFNPCNVLGYVLLSLSFTFDFIFWWGKWDSEKLINLVKVVHLINSETRIGLGPKLKLLCTILYCHSQRKWHGAILSVQHEGLHVSFKWYNVMFHLVKDHRYFHVMHSWKTVVDEGFFICLFCFVLTSGKTGKRTELNIFLVQLETIKAFWAKLPTLISHYCHAYFSCRLCHTATHRN